jgi:hypothetical protein
VWFLTFFEILVLGLWQNQLNPTKCTTLIILSFCKFGAREDEPDFAHVFLQGGDRWLRNLSVNALLE